MSESSQGIPSTNNSSNAVKMLDYRITRRADLSLAFDPPAGSRELANALSMKYPLCDNLEQQLQSALLDFINTENGESQKYTFKSPKNRQQSLSSNTSVTTIESSPSKTSDPKVALNNFQSSMLVWSITTGKPVEKKRNRIKYDTDKRVKVAGVRKSGACDFHRKKKTECTCNTSPISQKSPTRRRPSLTKSNTRSIDEHSLHSESAETPSVDPPSLEANAHNITTQDTDLFDANLPQLFDSDFHSNFDFWGLTTLPPSSDPTMALSTDPISDLSLFEHNNPTDPWHQEGIW